MTIYFIVLNPLTHLSGKFSTAKLFGARGTYIWTMIRDLRSLVNRYNEATAVTPSHMVPRQGNCALATLIRATFLTMYALIAKLMLERLSMS